MQLQVYSSSGRPEWNDFLFNSKNGTFLFYREYMEYHADRFEDFSLMARNEKGNIVALFPAHRRGEVLESHGGLTYGGFVTDRSMTLPLMLDVFLEARTFLKKKGFSKVIYKTIPSIYHLVPAEEDRYALFTLDAELFRRDVLSVIDLDRTLPYQKRRQRGIKRAQQSGLVCQLSDDLSRFWSILTSNLQTRHRVKPVHTEEEMTFLKSQFKDNIKLYGSFKDTTMLSGMVVYESPNVAHIQYTACSEEGKETGALDILADYLIEEIYRGKKKYLDFGVSTENEGRYLNVGLIDQKEGFGARTVVHDFYELDLSGGVLN